jgi:hypothetical protein
MATESSGPKVREIGGASAIQCCYAAIEIAEFSLPLDFLCQMNTKTVLAKRKNFGMDVKISRNVSRFLVKPVCIAGVLTSRPNFSTR